MKKRKHIRFQRRVIGGRDALPSCVIKEIRIAVENEAYKYGVSRSFVVAVILAKAFDIHLNETYEN